MDEENDLLQYTVDIIRQHLEERVQAENPEEFKKCLADTVNSFFLFLISETADDISFPPHPASKRDLQEYLRRLFSKTDISIEQYITEYFNLL